MTPYDSASFTAGKDTGTRMSACIARLAALELIRESRWWNRWRHRLQARALVACAEELESAAEESGPEATLAAGEAPSFRRDEPVAVALPSRESKVAGLPPG